MKLYVFRDLPPILQQNQCFFRIFYQFRTKINWNYIFFPVFINLAPKSIEIINFFPILTNPASIPQQIQMKLLVFPYFGPRKINVYSICFLYSIKCDFFFVLCLFSHLFVNFLKVQGWHSAAKTIEIFSFFLFSPILHQFHINLAQKTIEIMDFSPIFTNLRAKSMFFPDFPSISQQKQMKFSDFLDFPSTWHQNQLKLLIFPQFLAISQQNQCFFRIFHQFRSKIN